MVLRCLPGRWSNSEGMMQPQFVYITASSKDEARSIGRTLVESRLAACVNIVESITSFYWWNGEIQEDNEAAIIAKTKESLVQELIETVKAMHSYSCPCIVCLPIVAGNPPFLAWVEEETK